MPLSTGSRRIDSSPAEQRMPLSYPGQPIAAADANSIQSDAARKQESMASERRRRVVPVDPSRTVWLTEKILLLAGVLLPFGAVVWFLFQYDASPRMLIPVMLLAAAALLSSLLIARRAWVRANMASRRGLLRESALAATAQSAEASTRAMARENAAAAVQLQLIVRSLPVAFLLRDAEDRITLWNPEAERMFGFSAADALDKSPLDLIVPVTETAAATGRFAVIRDGEKMTVSRNWNVTKAGAMIRCEWRNARISGTDGEFAGSISMALDVTAQLQAELALAKGEERLRALVTLASDWEWEQDAQFRFTRITHWKPIAQQRAAAQLGRTRWENRCVRPVGFTWEEHRRLLEAHQPFLHNVFEITHPDGQRCYRAVRGEPMFAPDGVFSGYRGVGVDITKRYRSDAMRAAESDLFEQMARGAEMAQLAGILASALADAMERDCAVIIKELSRERLRPLASARLPDALGALFECALPLGEDNTLCGAALRANQPLVIASLAESMDTGALGETGGSGDIVLEPLHAAGVRAAWTLPVMDRNGTVIAAIGVLYRTAGAPSQNDLDLAGAVVHLLGFVLERFHAGELMRESAERYGRLVEQSQDGIVIHDWGVIDYVNPAMVRMAGASGPAALTGTPMANLLSPASRPLFLKRMAALRENGTGVPFAEMQLQCVDGTLIDVEVAASVFEVRGRKMVQAQYRDISARKMTERDILRLNQELEERVAQRTAELSDANRELEAFSYSVAHDLRAPLRTIDGFSQLLKRDVGSDLPAAAARDIDAISASAKRMTELINGLLEFSRYGRGLLASQRVATRTMVDLAVQDAARSNSHSAPTQFEIGTLPDVQGDPVLLRQVWSNLIGNAVKFSAKRGAPKVQIDARLVQQEYEFTVSDNGDGFDMACADKLFGVFQRLHSTSEFEGTGIGLAIVKRIVERHGGRVWAESAAGAGAKFCFTLPQSAVAAASAAAAAAH